MTSPATFSLVQVRDTYNLKGAVASRTETAIGGFSSPLAMYAELVRLQPQHLYLIKLTDRECVRIEKRLNDQPVDFSELFRIVEGDDAYNAVMEDRAPAQNEVDWVAAKLAA